jgi:hypothetical protein
MAIDEARGHNPFRQATNHPGAEAALKIASLVDAKLSELHRATRLLDRELSDMLMENFVRSSYASDLSRLRIRVEQASWSAPPRDDQRGAMALEIISTAVAMAGSALPFFSRATKRSFFKGVNLDIELLISMTDRLAVISETVSDRLYGLYSEQLQIKPDGVNVGDLSDLIDNALQAIEQSEIDDDVRKQLNTILKSSQISLNSRTPSWSEVVGALVIASTILSGIAAAPQAYQNVEQAIQYILRMAKPPSTTRTLPRWRDDSVNT